MNKLKIDEADTYKTTLWNGFPPCYRGCFFLLRVYGGDAYE
jgi:hypothetical protein